MCQPDLAHDAEKKQLLTSTRSAARTSAGEASANGGVTATTVIPTTLAAETDPNGQPTPPPGVS